MKESMFCTRPGKLLVKKTFFKSLTQKNAEVVNLRNPDLDLVRSILLECGFMIRFWISPKKHKIRFWIQESVSTPSISYRMKAANNYSVLQFSVRFRASSE